jgi:hypothetical protein
MDAVQRITQNVLSTSEETCGLGQRLVEAAGLLQQSVSRFKIGAGGEASESGGGAYIGAGLPVANAPVSPTTPLLDGKHHRNH